MIKASTGGGHMRWGCSIAFVFASGVIQSKSSKKNSCEISFEEMLASQEGVFINNLKKKGEVKNLIKHVTTI